MSETLHGVPLSTYVDDLSHTGPEHQAHPHLSFDLMERLGEKARAWLGQWSGTPEDHVSDMPLKGFSNLTFDQLCKVAYGGGCMHQSVRDLFGGDAGTDGLQHQLVEKIRSSMWRWGFGSDCWNQIVDAYDGIRRFDLAAPGFDVELDHTRWKHQSGRSKHAGVFLDSALAFLVRFRGEHVMTIGFSVASDRRILVTQIQNRSRSGNRWMFRFPRNRIEHILDRMAEAFPTHAILLADGGDVARRNLSRHDDGLLDAIRTIGRLERDIALTNRDPDWLASDIAELAKIQAALPACRERIAHLKAEMPRLTAAYADTGRWSRGASMKDGGIRHYEMRPATRPLDMAA